MQVLLLLFLMLPCVPEKWSPVGWISSPLSSGLLTWSGIALAVIYAGIIAYRTRKRLHHEPQGREFWLKRYARLRFVHTFSLFAVYLVALYGLGWGWSVQSCLGNSESLLPGGELIVLSPFFAGLVASWACFYDAECAIQATPRASARIEHEINRWSAACK